MKQFILFVLCVLTAFSMSAQGKLPFYDRGYAGNVELGCLVQSYPYASLSTTHGYSFGKGWVLGLGGAFESGLYERMTVFDSPDPGGKYLRINHKGIYTGDMMLTLFLDVRKTFIVKSTGIFVDFKLGRPFNLAEQEEGGISLRPSLGVVFGRHFALSAGLDWSRMYYLEPYLPTEITLPYIGFAYQF